MKRISFAYPGDPVQTGFLFESGREFKTRDEGWGGNPGEIRVNGELASTFEDPVCDLCNAGIGDEDGPLLSVDGYLHCPACTQRYGSYVKHPAE